MPEFSYKEIRLCDEAFRAAVTAALSADMRASLVLSDFGLRGADIHLMQGLAGTGIAWAANMCMFVAGLLDIEPLEAWQTLIEWEREHKAAHDDDE